ncbi:MAG: hypothetical protein MUF00_18245 [Gemmatimonadaceae bacterium]|jgi:hypothetical protein|nr:hypothetical protein [Gemmatimonadaceae bacterium]
MPRFVPRIVALLVAAFPLAAAAQTNATVTLLEYRATVPAGWTATKPTSSMRVAEYTVPTTAGVAELVVYYFGPGQGGSADANLARWKGQFSTPDGSPVYERITRDSTRVAALTIAEYRGTYARGVGAGSGPGGARPNNTLIAVVAETKSGTLFFQLFGANPAVAAARNAYLTFIRSMTPAPAR